MKRYAAALLIDGKRVLLAKRNITRSNYPGTWDFVGGHCEGNETFDEALQRELQEEIGVKSTEMVLLMVVDESPDFIMNLFLVTKWDGHVCVKPSLCFSEMEIPTIWPTRLLFDIVKPK